MKISDDIIQSLLDSGVLIYNLKTDTVSIAPTFKSSLWEVSLGFNNIAIKQKKNLCNSRLDVDIQSEIIKGIIRPIPMIASNMSTVCNADFCIKLYNLGALGVLHRAASEKEIIDEVLKINKSCELVAASIGIGDSQVCFAKKLIEAGCNIIFIDIAHGFSDSVIETGRRVKDLNSNIKIVIGNTTNVGLLEESADFIDAIKVGIATGYSCETKNTAGCTEEQFSAILKFKEISKELEIPVISDGGIREPADFVKSLAVVNSVMAGSIFARCPESAAETMYQNGKIFKIFAGMASRYVQNKWRGGLKDGTCPEGGIRYLDIGESVDKLLERYSGALRSGITYGGGKDIKSFQENVEFVRLK